MKLNRLPFLRRKYPHKMIRTGRARILAASVATLSLCAARSAFAASDAWTGANGTALWSDLGNWNPSVAVPGAGDTATFNAVAGAGGAVITTGNISLGTLAFAAGAAGYTIGGAAAGTGQITFADGTTNIITMASGVTNSQIVNANIILGTAITGNSTISNASTTNTLTIAGNITGGTGGTAAAKGLSVAGAGNPILSGAMTEGGAASIVPEDNSTGTLTAGKAGRRSTPVPLKGVGS